MKFTVSRPPGEGAMRHQPQRVRSRVFNALDKA